MHKLAWNKEEHKKDLAWVQKFIFEVITSLSFMNPEYVICTKQCLGSILFDADAAL